MKAVDRVLAIREQLDELEKFIEQGQQPADKQVEWLVKMLTRLELRLNVVLNEPGRPAYRVACESSLTFIRDIKRELDNWQVRGILPETIKWMEK